MAKTEFFDQLIGAQPGWDVLEYRGGYDYVAEPVVMWGCMELDGFMVAVPFTADSVFDPTDPRAISGPDGSVRFGQKHWGTISEWLADMKNGAQPNINIVVNPAPLSIAPLRERLRLLSSEDN